MKILFFLIDLNLGGTEKSFLNLIDKFPKDSDITLLLLKNKGDLLNSLPKNVSVKIIENENLINNSIKFGFNKLLFENIKKGNFLLALRALVCYVFSKTDRNRDYYYEFVKNKLVNIEGDYDYAIAFAGPHNFVSNFILNNVNSRKKIQWIHFDVSKISFSKYLSAKLYSRFNNIICVSQDVKNQFLKSIPQLESKVLIRHNVIPYDTIKALSEEKQDYDRGAVKILTVGRLTKEKGHSQFFNSFKKLKEQGFDFCWYIVGDGNCKEILEEKSVELGLSDCVKFLGKKMNPYPYFANCDIYLQPSIYEGHCVSILEAKFFNKPIICTSFAGASDEVSNDKNGIIVDFDEDLYFLALSKLIKDEDLRKRFGDYNKNFEFSNNFIEVDSFFDA